MCLIVGLLLAFAIDEVVLLAEPLWFADEDEDVPDCRLVELDELLLDDLLLLLRFAEVWC